MNKLSTLKYIVIAITLLLSQPAISLETSKSLMLPIQFPVVGRIKTISASHISVADFRFKISPTVKITLKENKKGRLQDLKAGDIIGLTLMKLGKKRLVDSIQLLK